MSEKRKRLTVRDGVEDIRLEAKNTKKSEAKDSSSEDRPSRGQGPRTQAQAFFKKKGLQKLFSGDLQKKVFKNFFQAVSN